MRMMKKLILIAVLLYLCPIEAGNPHPLNILFVVGYFPSLSQIYILNMITGLINRGHNVSIFSFHKSDELDMHPHVEKYKLLNRVIYENFPEILPECDIVFCQFGGLGKKILEIPNLSEWLQKRKMVVCLRGFDVMGYVNNPAGLNTYIFNKVDLFLPVCNYFKNRFIALGCNPEKIVVHHSAIDCTQFFFKIRQRPEQGIVHLISVCRLVKKKGIDIAIKALVEVIKKYRRVHYTIVGDGPERTYLELLIDQLSLQDKVTLCGWKNHDELVSILDQSHIFLLPSITPPNGNEEGISNALKEAMAMGLVSIATWHAGTPELNR